MEQTPLSTRLNLAKLDKSLYSKAEWQKIRDKRRQEKTKKKLEQVKTAPTVHEADEKYYIMCLKHGTKYSAEYVNRLYNMVQRHCTLPFEMVCLTEDERGIHPDITILPLDDKLSGWWCKPYMFSKDLPIDGVVLYMDLDVVIASNIDKLFTYSPNHWCVIRDFTRVMRPKYKGYNSSVIRFRTGQLDHVWSGFIKNHNKISRRYHGDQDWLFEADKTAMYWPDKWIMSWKWEIRTDKTFAPGGTKGNRKLRRIEHVKPPKECCITVFHGDPNPDNCDDPWVKENWC